MNQFLCQTRLADPRIIVVAKRPSVSVVDCILIRAEQVEVNPQYIGMGALWLQHWAAFAITSAM